MDLDGKVAIVTGASSGIGKAIAERFAWEGAEVVVADVDESGQEVAEEIDGTFVECDVSDYGQVEDLVETAVEEYGKLDIMVNNAGIGSLSGIDEMDKEEYEQVRSVDLDGVVYGTKIAAPHLEETEGVVINIASIYGLVGDTGATAYQAAKGGVVNFTRSVADDLADVPVRVNAICPGYIKTAMTDDLPEDFREHVMQETPMKRMGEPEEIASVAAFLASDEASYITGANIPVDGGWTSH
jgi:meso-butanediol dehydrogenase/(S,S)-butanediol dehydrogenase/diacetyl reductase